MTGSTTVASDDLSLRTLATYVGGTLSASGIALLAVAGANVLIGRMLGVDGEGKIAAATLIPMIVSYSGELALPVATGYLMNTDRGRRLETVATARCLALAMSAVLTCVSLLLILVLPFASDVRLLASVFSAFVALNLFYRLHQALLQSDLRLRAFNGIRMAGALTYLLILIGLAVGGEATTLRVIFALLVANLVWFGLSAIAASSRPWMAFDRRAAKALLGYGARAHVGNVSAIDALRLDQLVLALFLNTAQLGLYVAAMTVIIGNRVIGTSVGALCFPLASRGDRGRDPQARRHFRFLLGGTLVVSLAVALVEVLIGGRLLAVLFGPGFRPAGGVLQVLAVGSVFMNLRQVGADWLRGCGRPGIVSVSEVAGVVTLALLAALLWDGSVKPVAWAISVASVVALCAMGVGLALSGGGHRGAEAGSIGPNLMEAVHA